MNKIKLIIKNIRYLCTNDLSMLELKNQRVDVSISKRNLVGVIRGKVRDNPK